MQISCFEAGVFGVESSIAMMERNGATTKPWFHDVSESVLLIEVMYFIQRNPQLRTFTILIYPFISLSTEQSRTGLFMPATHNLTH